MWHGATPAGSTPYHQWSPPLQPLRQQSPPLQPMIPRPPAGHSPTLFAQHPPQHLSNGQHHLSLTPTMGVLGTRASSPTRMPSMSGRVSPLGITRDNTSLSPGMTSTSPVPGGSNQGAASAPQNGSSKSAMSIEPKAKSLQAQLDSLQAMLKAKQGQHEDAERRHASATGERDAARKQASDLQVCQSHCTRHQTRPPFRTGC